MRSASSSSFGCDDQPNWVSQVAGVGARYRLSAWVKSTSNTDKVRIRVYELSPSGSQVGSTSSSEIAISSSWQQLSVGYTAQRAGSALSMRITEAGGASNRTFLVDDVSIELIPAPPPGANLVGNPGFESNLDGWIAYGGGATLSRVTGGHSGDFALQIRSVSSSSFGCDDQPNWVSQVAGVGARYQLGAWVKSMSNTDKVKIRVYELSPSGSQIGSTSSSEIAISSSWQQLSVGYTAQRAGSALSMRITEAGGASNRSFLVDDVSIELVSSGPAAATVGGSGGAEAERPMLEFRAMVSPNPTRSGSVLRFATTRIGFVKVRLFDVCGREVRTLMDERDAAPGERTLEIARANLRIEPGVYFYRVEARDGTLAGRFVVLD
jgi:hypothetical protein